MYAPPLISVTVPQIFVGCNEFFLYLVGHFSGLSSSNKVFVSFQMGYDAHTLANDLIAMRSSCDDFFSPSTLLFEFIFNSNSALPILCFLSEMSTMLQKLRCHMNTNFSLISSGKSICTSCFAVFFVALVPLQVVKNKICEEHLF